MRLSDDVFIALGIVFIVILAWYLSISHQEIPLQTHPYKPLPNVINDLNKNVMLSLNYIPKGEVRISELAYYKTDIALFGEYVILSFKYPIVIKNIKESYVYNNVKAIIIYAERAENGTKTILFYPFSNNEDLRAIILMFSLIGQKNVNLTTLGIVANKSDVIQISGTVKINGQNAPFKEIKIIAYEEDGKKPNITDFIKDGVVVDKVLSDSNGNFRIRVLSLGLSKDAYIAIVASTKEHGYIIIKNKAGTNMTNVILEG